MSDTKELNSPLEMSDEDFLNAAPPSNEGFTLDNNAETSDNLTGSDSKSANTKNTQPKDQNTEDQEKKESQKSEENSDKQESQGDTEADEGTAGSEEGEGSDEGEEAKNKESASEDEIKDAKDKVKESQGEVDYKSVYEQIFAPFKANGKEIRIDSPDDVIQLMQMGANYNKKMAALKPNLALLKLLEKNDLLDEGKLSFLIDLDKKTPEAISKLIQDSGMDPLDLTAEKASGYKPNTYTVNQTEVELDNVIEDIKSSDAYPRTMDLVGNKWDAASRKEIANQPRLLQVINQHMETGVYDIISAELEKERLFGRLNDLSDIQAYKQIGDAIAAKGGFNHLFKQQGNPNPTMNRKPAPKVDQEAIDRLKDKKRAASSTKAAGPMSSVDKEFNPLAMSDEEFSKVSIDKFLK